MVLDIEAKGAEPGAQLIEQAAAELKAKLHYSRSDA